MSNFVGATLGAIGLIVAVIFLVEMSEKHGEDVANAATAQVTAAAILKATAEKDAALKAADAQRQVDAQKITDLANQLDGERNAHKGDKDSNSVVFDGTWTAWLLNEHPAIASH